MRERSQSTPFFRLPIELVCSILHYLDISDLLRCSMVNKYLWSIISESSSLQYTLELGIHRFDSVLPLSQGPPASRRLQTLRDREQSWRTLQWRKKLSIEAPATGSVYEFVGGYYGNGKDDDRKLTGSLSFFQLPAHGLERQLHGWMHHFPELVIIDFTMDPAQDLLIIVGLAPPESKHVYQMHLRTLSTNAPHPKAPVPVLGSILRSMADNVQPHELGATSVRIHVMGNIVALLIKQVVDAVGAHLELWDWNVGSQNSVQLDRNSGIDDFTLLSRDTFLVVRPSGMLEVLTFEDPATSSSKPKTRAVYQLPALSPGYIYWYICLTSNPSVGPNMRESCQCTCPVVAKLSASSKPQHETQPIPSDILHCSHCPTYSPSPKDRIHACCLYVLNPTAIAPAIEQVHSFVFFIDVGTFLIHSPNYKFSPTNARTMLNGVPRFPTGTSASLSPRHASSTTPQRSVSAPPLLDRKEKAFEPIPWDKWGPATTRWFRERISTDWQHAVYGYRTVETINIPKAEWDRDQRIRDSAARQRRARRMNGQEPPPAPGQSSNEEADEEMLGDASTWEVFAEAGLAEAAHAFGLYLTPAVHINSSSSTTISNGSISVGSPENTASEETQNPESDDEDSPLIPLRPGRRRIRVRDFNPNIARRELARRNAKGKGKASADDTPTIAPSLLTDRLITEPSVLPAKGIFKQDIVSSLPYREVVSKETFNVSDVMLDECRILLIKRGTDGQLKGIDVLTM